MTGQLIFFSKTAVTPEQKVEKSILRWEMNGHSDDDEEDKCTWHEFLTMIVQAVLSVFIDTTFLFGMPLLEGRGPSAGLENIKDKYTSPC